MNAHDYWVACIYVGTLIRIFLLDDVLDLDNRKFVSACLLLALGLIYAAFRLGATYG